MRLFAVRPMNLSAESAEMANSDFGVEAVNVNCSAGFPNCEIVPDDGFLRFSDAGSSLVQMENSFGSHSRKCPFAISVIRPDNEAR